jgi:hypothetical protein
MPPCRRGETRIGGNQNGPFRKRHRQIKAVVDRLGQIERYRLCSRDIARAGQQLDRCGQNASSPARAAARVTMLRRALAQRTLGHSVARKSGAASGSSSNSARAALVSDSSMTRLSATLASIMIVICCRGRGRDADPLQPKGPAATRCDGGLHRGTIPHRRRHRRYSGSRSAPCS